MTIVYCSEYDDCDHDNNNDEYCCCDSNLSLVDDNNAVANDEFIETLPQGLDVFIEACNKVDFNTEVVQVLA